MPGGMPNLNALPLIWKIAYSISSDNVKKTCYLQMAEQENRTHFQHIIMHGFYLQKPIDACTLFFLLILLIAPALYSPLAYIPPPPC